MWRVLFLPLAAAYYLAIDPEQQPILTLYDGDIADWSTGLVGALLDTSRAVRVNSRGIHFYGTDVDSVVRGQRCVRVPYALCKLNDGSVVLPFAHAPRVRAGGHCKHSRHRVLGTVFNDISACDVVEGTDILFVNETVFIDEKLALPLYLYVFVALVVLFLVVSLGQNLTHLLGDRAAATYPVLTELACTLLVSALVISHDPWRVWVSQHDRFMFVVLLGYLLIYLLRHGFELYRASRFVYTFNVIVGCLILTTARLYCTFETPYATIFLVLLTSRFFHKCHSHRYVLLLACDALLIAFLYYWSFRPLFFDTNEAPVYLVGILFVTHKIGEFTSKQECAHGVENGDLVDGIFAKQSHFVAARADGGDARHNAELFKMLRLAI